MTHHHRSSSLHRIGVLLAVLLALFATPARAVPPLPSEFYGYVTSGGAPVADGTLVTAWISGVQRGQAATFTYQGQSVYQMSVAGDDPDTVPIDGGRENDPIVFKVGGVVTPQAGVWHSGTNVSLDLTVPQTEPELVSVTPNSSTAGRNLNVTVIGANTSFAAGVTTATFGAGITVNTVTVSNTTAFLANISVAGAAVAGPRTVTVTTGAETVSKVNAFTVFGANIPVFLPANATAGAGTRATLPVTTVVNLSGRGIVAYQFELTYDAGVVQATGVSKADTLSAGWEVVENHSAPGQLSVATYGDTPLSGAGVLVNLLFTVIGEASDVTPLTFTSFKFNADNPRATLNHGSLSVQGLTLAGVTRYFSGTAPAPGVVLELAGAAEMSSTTDANGQYGFTVPTVGNYTVTPGKARYAGPALSALDAAYIAQCVVGKRPPALCSPNASDVDVNGVVMAYDAALVARYIVGRIDAVSQAGVWAFNPAVRSYTPLSGSQSGQNFTAYVRGDASANWPGGASTAEVQPARVIRYRVEHKDAEVWVVLGADLAAEDGVLAYQVDVDYDPNVLVFADAAPGDGPGAGRSVEAYAAVAGLVRLAGYSVDEYVGAGELAVLKFTPLAADGAATGVGVTNCQLNEGTPAVLCEPESAGRNLYLPVITQ